MSVHQKALDKAKIQLMARPDSMFFTTVCFSMKHIWDESISTAGTNGLQILFNPAFFMELDPEEQVFLLLHETLHVALDHITRKGERDHSTYNAAADYVINLMLVNTGFRMPQGGLLDRKYEGWSTGHVYEDLMQNPPPKPPPVPWDDIIQPGTEEESQIIKDAIDDVLVRAALQSKIAGDKPGSIPGEIELYINSLLNPKLPWNRILQRYITKLSKNQYTWRKPNRRYFPKHRLPTQYSESLCDIAVAIDTSGSVSDAEFHRFASETYAILKHEKPTSLTLLQFDTEIRNNTTIHKPSDLKNTTFTGRGGTRIGPVIEWAAANRPNLLLIFTDGGFHNHSPDPKLPIIWMINDNPKWQAPWGKVIHFDT